MKLSQVLKLSLLISTLSLSANQIANANSKNVEIWKSASCGCCGGWVSYMRKHGYKVKVHNVDNPSKKMMEVGIPEKYASCHTAMIDGYAIEGHVPVVDIERLLSEKTKATGLAVPGMPASAPGMDMGNKPFPIFIIYKDGTAKGYRINS